MAQLFDEPSAVRHAGAILYVAGLVFAEALRLTLRIDRLQSRRRRIQDARRLRLRESVVLAAIILGIWVLPIVYALTPWLGPFDYLLPSWTVWAAAGVFAASLLVRFSAQRSLGSQWSYTVETQEEHRLVTAGLYARVRHPIYASLILWAAAQPVLLQNLIAGWSGAAVVALIWLLRVPSEERAMVAALGDEYRRYMERTGRLLPRRQRPRPTD